MTTMSWDLSCELAGDERFTKVDLDEIRRELKPNDQWNDEEWEDARQSRCAERVFGVFAFFEMCQTIGWVEHTNDWDWWIGVKDTSGTKHHFGCGSFFQYVTDKDGTVFDNAKSAAENGTWHAMDKDSSKVTITVLGIIESDEELTEEEAEQSVTFKVSEISEIVIGYDT
jgi:hypothetical protein